MWKTMWKVGKTVGIHDGHRERIKEQFRRQGLDGMPEHSVLEILLFYAIHGGDVNPLAHTLINRFGSLAGVFDAPIEELMRVDGVGVNTATLIKLIPQISKQYLISREGIGLILNSTEKAGRFLVPRYYGEKQEVVFLISLDAKMKVLNCTQIGRGSVNSADVSIRKIVSTALLDNATGVILSHNHTSGIALPSKDDEQVTRKIAAALKSVEVELIDHIVVADSDFVSMRDNGFFS